MAARMGLWAVTHLTPAESESLFRELGGMTPSRSTLDRLPKGRIKQELEYSRRNRSRMDYARLRAQNLPIGSGVVEATCKTLVTQGMKRSGQRWSTDGGQAILTFRALAQRDRFDPAWQIVSAEYRRDVSFPENVLPINAYRAAPV